MIVWCFDDAHNWGRDLLTAANVRGHDARLFDNIRQVKEPGVVFLHMHAHPAVRLHHKRIAAHFASDPDYKLIPNYRLSSLYDDKLEQLRQLSPYMPPTRIFTSPTQARNFLETQPPLPIVSKSAEGSGVRIQRTYDDLYKEIRLAFSDLGVKNRFGVRHHGYVFWQKYTGDHDYIMRVISIGQQRMIVRRGRRQDNGSRPLAVITELDNEATSALTFAHELITTQRFNWGAFDLIRYGDTWKLLKLTVGWHVTRYSDCVFLPANRKGSDVWEVLLDEIERGNM